MTMNNPGDRDNYRSENRQESYTDANGETRTHVQRTTETVHNTPNSYGSGYVSGRDSERRYQQANLAERDNSNTANGLLIGVILTSLVTLGAAALWYFNQRNNPAVDNTAPVVVPVPVPNSASPSPAASQSPQSRTTIIERTREVPVVIPQQQAPASSAPAPAQPNINITVPSQRPAAEKAPTSSPQNPTTNTPAQDKKSDSLTNTPLSGADKSNTNSNSGASSSGDSTTGGSSQ
ncbi:MAG: hypothetical protein RMX68_023660 [Aulosira sp. ZfuVER01]|nr:hypothetical protein [Aulosira sp. ZfuVER01]MDZ8001198.1 hypothetical protein [Aulosira sp. DedVER01a]MDZ8050855.1 hypothetical protein [Aulosira sp. ZfuCHP01]